MIVCFRCTPETKEDLNRLLASGSYGDIGEAIAAAVRNQVLIEQEVGKKWSIVIGGGLGAGASGEPVVLSSIKTKQTGEIKKTSPAKQGTNGRPVKNGSVGSRVLSPPNCAEDAAHPVVPELFRLESFPRTEPRGLAALPPDLWSHGQSIPLDRWVLGQFNRLLPAKANARALVRLFLQNSKGLEIASAATQIAAQAALLGDYLRQIDTKHGVSRDDALATAFPSAEEGSEKGRNRYANQFVVYQNGKGELSGLMVDLKMINVVQHRTERRIVPTRVAWEFASLANALLDGTSDGLPEKFSAQERAFLIAHILRSVPVEAFAYRVILQTVSDGQTSPEQIDGALKVYLDDNRAENLSQSFLASQRSGAVSRMSDLGLIERRREGVRVNYVVTEDGMTFLNQSTDN
jgi:hypothetical protein